MNTSTGAYSNTITPEKREIIIDALVDLARKIGITLPDDRSEVLRYIASGGTVMHPLIGLGDWLLEALSQEETYTMQDCPRGRYAQSDVPPNNPDGVSTHRIFDASGKPIADFWHVYGTNLWQRAA